MSLKKRLKKYDNFKKFFKKDEWDKIVAILEKIQNVPPCRELSNNKFWGYQNFHKYNPETAGLFLDVLFPWEMEEKIMTRYEISQLKEEVQRRESLYKYKSHEQNKKTTS